MNEKIKIIIADDNVFLCKQIQSFLKKYSDIEILGIANTNEKEIEMIEKLKPEIVITDLVRNHEYTGLDIIKSYFGKNNSPKFLVISSDSKTTVIKDGLEIAGYIQKGIGFNEDDIIKELRKIKNSEVKNEK